MRTSVFVGTSLDGFIARVSGAFDFLFPSGNEPHGYEEFMATVDALVIGRNTYDTVLAMPEWPYTPISRGLVQSEYSIAPNRVMALGSLEPA